MKKQFIKSLALGVASLTLIASCSMIKGKCEGKCASNKCSSKNPMKLTNALQINVLQINVLLLKENNINALQINAPLKASN